MYISVYTHTEKTRWSHGGHNLVADLQPCYKVVASLTQACINFTSLEQPCWYIAQISEHCVNIVVLYIQPCQNIVTMNMHFIAQIWRHCGNIVTLWCACVRTLSTGSS